jgi:hypothetical protein
MAKTYRRHIRNLLLDRKFQLRFTVVIVLVATVLTAGLGYFWYDEMRKASKMVEVKALVTLSDADQKKVMDDLARQDQIRLLILVGFGLTLSLFLTGFSIWFTHKVAGPLFKIGRHMRDLRDNDLKPVWDLRKGDQLQEFWVHFKEMHTAMRERQQAELNALRKVLDLSRDVASSSELKDALGDLDRIAKAKAESLGLDEAKADADSAS